MIIAVTGGRNFWNRKLVWDTLDKLSSKFVNVKLHVGGASGVDTLAEKWAIARNVPFIRFDADWEKYGRSAGPMRNAEMIRGASMLLAFPGGKGTENAKMIAYNNGMPVYEVRG